jgi:hypothetical protein
MNKYNYYVLIKQKNFEDFSKEEVQMARKHEERLTIPGHKGNANQNTLRFHLTAVRMAASKDINRNKCW